MVLFARNFRRPYDIDMAERLEELRAPTIVPTDQKRERTATEHFPVCYYVTRAGVSLVAFTYNDAAGSEKAFDSAATHPDITVRLKV